MKPILTVRPVARYSEPAYPSRRRFLAAPDVLRRTVPGRWTRRGLAAAAAALGTLAGCQSERMQNNPPEESKPVESGIQEPEIETTPPEPPLFTSSRIAPIFHHGKGRGQWGGYIMSSSYFLSEEEAREIIEDELSRYGLTFRRDAYQVDDVIIPGQAGNAYERDDVVRIPPPETEEEKRILPSLSRTAAVVLDGLDDRAFVAYEFISLDDENKLRPNVLHYGMNRLVSTKLAAERLTDSLAARNIPTIGVFYDPQIEIDIEHGVWGDEHYLTDHYPEIDALKTRIDAFECSGDMDSMNSLEYLQARKDLENAMTAKLREIYKPAYDDLRAQAHDFGEWLVAQGIVSPPENPDAPDSDEEIDP